MSQAQQLKRVMAGVLADDPVIFVLPQGQEVY